MEPIFSVPPVTIHQRFSAMGRERRPWSLENRNIRALGPQRGRGITVAVIDTGVDKVHCLSGDLRNKVKLAKDFTGSHITGTNDAMGHGSHVAGIIGGLEDEFGGVGVAPGAELLCYKGLDDYGSGTEQSVVQAFAAAISDHPHIINFSGGSPVKSTAIIGIIEEALARGIHVIVAAGNFGDHARSWPAMHPGVVSVAATDENDAAANFSEPSSVDAACPGVKILSTYRHGTFALMDGTSMAAPYLTGLLACYLSHLIETSQRLPKPSEVFALIERWSVDIGDPGRDEKTGFGIPSVERYRATVPKPEAKVDVWKPIGTGWRSWFDTADIKACQKVA